MESKGKSKKRLIIIMTSVGVLIAILVTVFLLIFTNKDKEDDVDANQETTDDIEVVQFDQVIEDIEEISIIAENTSEYGIVSDTDFILETEQSEELTTEVLKRHLRIDPIIPFDMVDEGDGTYRIKLSSNMDSDSIVKISLVRESEDFGWAFQTEAVFGMTRSLPTNDAYSAPLNTGIEMVFNHEAPENMASYFAISPNISGSFEYYKNIVTFVPDNDLSPNTQYRVTIAEGYGYEDDYIEVPVVFAFFTEYFWENETPITFVGSNQLLIEGEEQKIDFTINDDLVSGESVSITMYRLANDQAFIDGIGSLKNLRNKDDIIGMVDYDTQSNFDTVIKTNNESYMYEGWVDLDEILERGYYLVRFDLEGANFYQFVQVSPYQAYIAQDSDELFIWAMNSISDSPAGNLYVYVNGDLYGVTDPDGVCQTNIAPLTEDDIDFVILTDDQNNKLVVDMTLLYNWYNDGYYEYGYGQNKDYWSYIDTDREVYLPTDDIHIFGFLQRRDGNTPDQVTVKVSSYQAELEELVLPLSDIGTYETEFHIDNFFFGSLYIEIWDGDVIITSEYIMVNEFALPTYRLDIDTSKDVLMMSDSIEVTVQTSFYDGTPASGSNIEIDSYGYYDYLDDNLESMVLETDADGYASATIVPYLDGTNWYPTYFGISGTNMSFQDYYNYTNKQFVIFPRDTMVEAKSTVEGDTLTTSGSVHNIDITGFEGNLYAYDSFRGTAQSGTDILAVITEEYTEKVFVGQEYDAINHVSYDNYDYNLVVNTVSTQEITTAEDGSFSVTYSGVIEGRSYRVNLNTNDTKGRAITETIDYYQTTWHTATYEGIIDEYYNLYLNTDNWEYAQGEDVSIWLDYSGYPIQDRENNYAMYLICQDGFKKSIYSEDLTSTYQFDASSIPNVVIKGIFYDGHQMIEIMQRSIFYNYEEEQLDVVIDTDRSEYGAGDSVTTAITITDTQGNPVIADFSLSVIDEAYFDIYSNWDVVLAELYSSVYDAGIIQSGIASGFTQSNYGGGAEGGDGYAEGYIREDFEITADFITGTTNASGKANLVFELPDNLTTWRLTAIGISADLEAGESTHNIIVTQPYYVNVTMADKYIVGDDIKLTVNSAGKSVVGTTEYTITVTPMDSSKDEIVINMEGDGIDYVAVPLGQLETGKYEVTIAGVSGSESDALKLPFEVVDTYQELKVMTSDVLDDNYEVPDTGHMVSLYMVNQAAREHLSNLYGFYSMQESTRIDIKIAAIIAGLYINDIYKSDLEVDMIDDINRYMPTGLFSETTYSGEDPKLTAEILTLDIGAIIDDYTKDVLAESLRTYMGYDWISEDERYATIWALASLNKPVLLQLYEAIEVEEARNTDLTYSKLYGLLSLIELGDLERAKTYYGELIDQYTTTSSSDIILSNGDRKMTAYLMLAATKLELLSDADKLYETMSRTNDTQDSTVIERLIYTMASKPEVTDASFTIKVGEKTTDVALSDFDVYSVGLTKEEVGQVSFDNIEGGVGVNTTFIGTPEDMTVIEGIEIDRVYLVDGELVTDSNINQGDIVDVVITVTIPEDIGGIQIEDVLPSGMVYYDYDYNYDTSVYYESHNKEVVMTAYRAGTSRTIVAEYRAIATSQGTYTADYLVVYNLFGIGGNYIDQEEVVINP
ncbi:MAG: hypothetical protein PF505_07255 [Vallitaleaceae bacterium]|nr:hypothetical protein [Vallitaleaceae bacterium]